MKRGKNGEKQAGDSEASAQSTATIPRPRFVTTIASGFEAHESSEAGSQTVRSVTKSGVGSTIFRNWRVGVSL